MLNFFKRGGKDKSEDQELVPWGTPVKRKMSRDEAAREEAAQRQVEKANQERRDMYRLAGNERIFEDNEGRRLAIRTEDNSGPNPNPEHAPLCVTIFWGVRELGHLNAAAASDGTLHFQQYVVEQGYDGRGLAATLLGEVENFARAKRLTALVCAPPPASDEEWSNALAQAGFSQRAATLVKSL